MIEQLESRRLLAAVVPGDATFDGKVNIDDYALLDGNAVKPGPFTAAEGDLNGDTKLNVDDYGIIDANIGSTGAVHRLVLINAATNQEIGELTDGMTIDIGKTPNLNVRADTVGYQVGSVKFIYDNADYRTESSAPYAFAGDINGGTYQSWTPSVGEHSISARSFSLAGGTGIRGGETDINFTVIQSDPTVDPDPTPNPNPTGFPDASNTGPTNRSILEVRGAFNVTQEGAVIENFIVRDGGQIVISANNVTLRNFVIENPQTTGAAIKFASNDVTGGLIENGEIFGGIATNAVSGSNYTARRLHIHHMQADAFRVKSNVTIEASYIHDIGIHPDSHGDGVQMYPTDGGNMRIIGNTIDARNGNAALFQVDNGWHVEGNYFAGGNYTLYVSGQVENKFINNTFAGSGPVGTSKYGPVRVGAGDASLMTWTGNVWEATGQEIRV
jgi:hypothetical protein